ncbi:MAG: hypothetical protein CMK07_08905 [Ponticaulis sp.]|nr:hypothetical protein [Ponticaulis sp.]
MTDSGFSPVRTPRPFVASETRLLIIDNSGFARSIMMEVLRGVGIKNDHVSFSTADRFLKSDVSTIMPDVLLYVHTNDEAPDLGFIRQLRVMNDIQFAEIPVIYLSPIATEQLIVGARDAGADEFMARPVSSNQLSKRLKKVIEDPRPFISSANYVGPCRRRKTSAHYAGPRRRLDDFKKEQKRREIPTEHSTNDLVIAIAELRQACGELSDDRTSLVARVREMAVRTMRLARDTDDNPLLLTATSVKYYLDGVGRSHMIEPHVLETGINALTQLSTLPNSYDTARNSVANLMSYAVRKKLALYQKRKDATDPEMEEAFNRINEGATAADEPDANNNKKPDVA